MSTTQKNIIQRVVVGALVKDNNKILILRRSPHEKVYPGLWELPSGKKENLEDCETALRREIFEETGLKVRIDKIFGAFNYLVEKGGGALDTTQVNYIVHPQSANTVKLSEEHDQFVWIGLDDLPKYKISKESKELIIQALE